MSRVKKSHRFWWRESYAGGAGFGDRFAVAALPDARGVRRFWAELAEKATTRTSRRSRDREVSCRMENYSVFGRQRVAARGATLFRPRADDSCMHGSRVYVRSGGLRVRVNMDEIIEIPAQYVRTL